LIQTYWNKTQKSPASILLQPWHPVSTTELMKASGSNSFVCTTCVPDALVETNVTIYTNGTSLKFLFVGSTSKPASAIEKLTAFTATQRVKMVEWVLQKSKKHVLTMSAASARSACKTVFTIIPTWRRPNQCAKTTHLAFARGDLSAQTLTLKACWILWIYSWQSWLISQTSSIMVQRKLKWWTT